MSEAFAQPIETPEEAATRRRNTVPYEDTSVAIDNLLKKHGGNQSAAAEEIGYTPGVFRAWRADGAVPLTASLAIRWVLKDYGNPPPAPQAPRLDEVFERHELVGIGMLAAEHGKFSLSAKVMSALAAGQ